MIVGLTVFMASRDSQSLGCLNNFSFCFVKFVFVLVEWDCKILEFLLKKTFLLRIFTFWATMRFCKAIKQNHMLKDFVLHFPSIFWNIAWLAEFIAVHYLKERRNENKLNTMYIYLLIIRIKCICLYVDVL